MTKYVFQLAEIMSYLPGHIYWKDVDGVYHGCNLGLARLINKSSPSEIVGKKIEDLVDEKYANMVKDIDDEVMKNNKKLTIEEPAFDASGNPAYYFTQKLPLHDNEGKVIGLLGISLDVTERKMAEQAAIEAKQQALAANRAKTEFLANMSHDMKTPLSGIVTTAEVIVYDEGAREKDRQFASIISASGKQLSEFFTSCLDLSKLEMEEWASTTSIFSPRKLVQDIYDLYLPKAMGSDLSLSVVYDPNLPEAVEGHHDSLYRALLNLAGNALKFTKQGSVILRVFCGEKIDNEHTTIVFEVQDTGMGIPEDKFKVIFEKLQRLTPSYSSNIEGSGIGLYIVDQFIKRMGGNIQVHSEVGKGSTFTVSVPMRVAHIEQEIRPTYHTLLTTKPEAPVVKITETPTTLDNNSPRVLLVEDVPIIQIATKSLLNGAGFYVDTASSGKEALELCASRNYGVIYMDIGLPDMQGYEVAQLIREQEKATGKAPTPMIALTGHGATDVQSFCGNAGMQGVISKPLLREQAEAVWKHYVDQEAVTVPSLTALEKVSMEPVIFDLAATVAVLGSELKAQEMMQAFIKELQKHYLVELITLTQENDRAGLRFLLHQLVGCLMYVIFPPLQAAIADLHQAAREETGTLDELHQRVIHEINRVIALAML